MLERKGSDEQIKLSFVEGWSMNKREENTSAVFNSSRQSPGP
jgi:hypothetical protein